jgi:glycosyltransferase involved in cell wall biosynthesis
LHEALDAAFDVDYGLTLEVLSQRYQHQVEQKAQQVEQKAQQAEQKAQQAEQKAQQAAAASEQVLLQLRAVYASTSWRITAPMRWLSSCARGFVGRFVKPGALLVLQHGVLYIRARLRLKNRILALLFEAGLGCWILDRLAGMSSVIGGTQGGAQTELAPVTDRPRHLYVDVTGVAREDLRTGIQRVIRGLLVAMFKCPPAGFEIKPVYAREREFGYCHAIKFARQILEYEVDVWDESVICPELGDVFLGLDFQAHAVVVQEPYLTRLHGQGLKVCFVVYDLLPVLHPEWFPYVASVGHAKWLKTILKFDEAACISSTVAQDVKNWVRGHAPDRVSTCAIHVFPLGADIGNSIPSSGLPEGANEILMQLAARLCFLMVGTVEPRKGHEQVLIAFEQLWAEGRDMCLVVVGKQGWKVQQLADHMSTHPERNKRFFWLQGISDEYLEKLYSASTCLIAASYGEGFGLPLIEAAQHGIPILARDIPEFREVAGASAYYFQAETPVELAAAVLAWQTSFERKQHPSSRGIPYATWSKSVEELYRIVLSCRERPVDRKLMRG